jgi:hypothetical protein
MTFSVTPHAFTTEAEARAEIDAAGWYPMLRDVQPEHNTPHYHDFDSVIFVLDGSMDFFEVETGIHHRCGPGSRVEDSGPNVHREEHDGYRALVGFKEDPEVLFTQPRKIEV